MSEPFISEIRVIAFNYPPRGWSFCNGQLLQINQNQALFSLLGTTYGGDGRTTFGLPDLRGRAPIHRGNTYPQGARGGEATHTLIQNEIPTHVHTASATNANANLNAPAGNLLAQATSSIYGNPVNLQPLNQGTISIAGSSQPHQNMQPYLVLNFIIALQGIFPSRN